MVYYPSINLIVAGNVARISNKRDVARGQLRYSFDVPAHKFALINEGVPVGLNEPIGVKTAQADPYLP
jgi:hypothetical protein